MYHSAVDPSWQMHFLPLGSKEFTAYWKEMSYCVDFALCNRKLMMNRIMEIVADAIPQVEFGQIISIAHNYASWEHHYGNDVIVHRKGAVRAMAGETGIIPGSQGTSSYIVEGLGCPGVIHEFISRRRQDHEPHRGHQDPFAQEGNRNARQQGHNPRHTFSKSP